MKVGMTAIVQQHVNNKLLGDRWVWLCETEGEWATYVSSSADKDSTEFGHYFWDKKLAVNDFNERIRSYQ